MKRHPLSVKVGADLVDRFSILSLWFLGLFVRFLWFIETWWGQRKRDKNLSEGGSKDG